MEESPVVLREAVASRDVEDDEGGAVAVQVMDASVVAREERRVGGGDDDDGDARMRGVTPSPEPPPSSSSPLAFHDAEEEEAPHDRKEALKPSSAFRSSSAVMVDPSMLGDHELVERQPSFRDTGPPAVSIVPGPPPAALHGGGESPAGFDVCKEYGYRYEYADDDEEEDESDRRHCGGGSADDESDSDDEEGAHRHARHVATDTTGCGSGSALGGASPLVGPAARRDDSCGSTYLVGRRYHPLTDYGPRREYESSLLWFTYRSDFTPIEPYGISTDAGWGCMLRSAQMMMAHALRVWLMGREWRPPRGPSGGPGKGKRRGEEGCLMRDVMTWFADFPSAPPPLTGAGGNGGGNGPARANGGDERRYCHYSLHNMVASGLARYEMLPGEWYGPGTACHVLRDLAEMHARHDDFTGYCRRTYGGRGVPRVHVAGEGCVYDDAVDDLMTRDGRAKAEAERERRKKRVDPADGWENGSGGTSSEDDPSVLEDPLLHPLSSPSRQKSEPPLEWDTALLLLIPLRLGLRSFDDATYGDGLAAAFGLPQSVGFVGGSPRHALWFYGAATGSDGDAGGGSGGRSCMANFGDGGDLRWSRRVYGLDPHTVQSSPRRNPDGSVHLSDAYLRSVRCPYPSSMDLGRIDPSLALGFLCEDRADLRRLRESMSAEQWTERKRLGPPLVAFADRTPDYAADVSGAMAEMMMSAASAGSNPGGNHGNEGMPLRDGTIMSEGDEGGGMSDEDEYVML